MHILHAGKKFTVVQGMLQQHLRDIAAGKADLYLRTGDDEYQKLTVRQQNRADEQGAFYEPDVWAPIDTDKEFTKTEREALAKL